MKNIDQATLARWLEGAVSGLGHLVALEKFAGGQSNPTYRMDTSNGRYVLRRKPFGKLLPSAHAVEREYRLLTALQPTGFPVPRPIAICEDVSVIGAAFYVMEMVEGRTFWNATLPEVARPERRPIFDAMIDTLAALHNLDHEKLGLGDFGRSGNYFARQVERWTKQYRSAQTDDIPEVESLIDWLSQTLPEQGRTSIIHGDYRIDNLIYAVSGSDVLAVLDWELATVGDPLADFTYLAMNWVLTEDGRSGLMGVDLEGEGLPTLGEAVARYCTATSRDSMPNLPWYFAYNLFRLVCILQGVKKRFVDGNASSDQAESMAAKVQPLAKAAWAEARRAGTRH